MPRRFANPNARARVSKDEDGRGMALMLRDASQRIWGAEAPALASRCDAPQHEGEGAPRILAKRTQLPFWRNVPKDHLGSSPRKRGPIITAGGYGSRLSPRCREGSAGTTAGSVSSINLWLCEMMAGAASLFPACSLQGMMQLQRVGPPRPMWHHPRNPICHQSSS